MVMGPMLAFFLICLVMAAGDYVSVKTKAFIPSVFISASLFLLGFWSVLPLDISKTAGLEGNIVTVTLLVLIVHMGTLMNIDELIAEWRSIVIALAGLLGMGLFLLTIGKYFVGWEVVVTGTPPLMGGGLAAIIMAEAAKSRGLQDLAVLSIVIFVMQGFVGYPLTALALKKEGKRLLGLFHDGSNAKQTEQRPATLIGNERFRIFKPMSEEFATPFIVFARFTLIAWLTVVFSDLTGEFINRYVTALIFGAIASQIGFLERKPLLKSLSFGFFILCQMTFLLTQLNRATPDMLFSIFRLLCIIIVVGVSGCILFAWVAGKLLGYSAPMSVAIALTALYGFPPNYILTEEASRALTSSQEERQFLMDRLLPKMLVGGFTTVTVASVIIAGIFAKLY